VLPYRLWYPPIQCVQGVKRQERVADSVPSSSDVKDLWGQIYAPIYAFMAWYLNTRTNKSLSSYFRSLRVVISSTLFWPIFFLRWGWGCGCQNLGLLHALTSAMYWTSLNTVTSHPSLKWAMMCCKPTNYSWDLHNFRNEYQEHFLGVKAAGA